MRVGDRELLFEWIGHVSKRLGQAASKQLSSESNESAINSPIVIVRAVRHIANRWSKHINKQIKQNRNHLCKVSILQKVWLLGYVARLVQKRLLEILKRWLILIVHQSSGWSAGFDTNSSSTEVVRSNGRAKECFYLTTQDVGYINRISSKFHRSFTNNKTRSLGE